MYNVDIVNDNSHNQLILSSITSDLSRIVIFLRDGVIDFVKEKSCTFYFRITSGLDVVILDQDEVYFFQGQILTGCKTMERQLCCQLMTYLSTNGWIKIDFDPMLTRT